MLFYIKKVVSRKRIVKGNWEEMINYIGEKLREDEVLDVKWINFFFFFLPTLMACENSQFRDWTCATGVTLVVTVTMQDP